MASQETVQDPHDAVKEAPKVQQRAAVERAFYVHTLDVDGAQDLSEASAWLHQMLVTLMTIGGTLQIRADRAQVGDLAPGEPHVLTAGLVAQWTSQSGRMRDVRPESQE